MYNAQYFIDMLSDIPDNKWCTKKYVKNEGTDAQQCCFYGHLGVRSGSRMNETKRLEDLLSMLKIYRDNVGFVRSLSSINDGESMTYNQKTPKERMIAFFTDMKAAGL